MEFSSEFSSFNSLNLFGLFQRSIWTRTVCLSLHQRRKLGFVYSTACVVTWKTCDSADRYYTNPAEAQSYWYRRKERALAKLFRLWLFSVGEAVEELLPLDAEEEADHLEEEEVCRPVGEDDHPVEEVCHPVEVREEVDRLEEVADEDRLEGVVGGNCPPVEVLGEVSLTDAKKKLLIFHWDTPWERS